MGRRLGQALEVALGPPQPALGHGWRQPVEVILRERERHARGGDEVALPYV